MGLRLTVFGRLEKIVEIASDEAETTIKLDTLGDYASVYVSVHTGLITRTELNQNIGRALIIDGRCDQIKTPERIIFDAIRLAVIPEDLDNEIANLVGLVD